MLDSHRSTDNVPVERTPAGSSSAGSAARECLLRKHLRSCHTLTGTGQALSGWSTHQGTLGCFRRYEGQAVGRGLSLRPGRKQLCSRAKLPWVADIVTGSTGTGKTPLLLLCAGVALARTP